MAIEWGSSISGSTALGFSSRVKFRAVPITEVIDLKAKLLKSKYECKLECSGKCRNLPDGQIGKLWFTTVWEDRKAEPIRTSVQVKFKLTEEKNAKFTSFKLLSSDNDVLILDPLECHLWGRGYVNLRLEIDFPHAPTVDLENAFNFNFPVGVNFTAQRLVGARCSIEPIIDPIFANCSAKLKLLETDADEPEPRKGFERSDYAVEFYWKKGDDKPQIWHVGCLQNDPTVLAYCSEAEFKDLDIHATLLLSRDDELFIPAWTSDPPETVPKPVLSDFKLHIVKTQSAFELPAGEYQILKTPSSVYVFWVEGKIDHIARGFSLPLEISICYGMREKIEGVIDTLQQTVFINKDGTFKCKVGRLFAEEFPEVSDSKELTFMAAIRVCVQSVWVHTVPATWVLSSTYLPADCYTGSEYLYHADSWYLSAASKADGTHLPMRQTLVTVEEFQSIIPEASAENIARCIKPLDNMFREFEINTKLRIAYFLCHVPVETANLEKFEQVGTTSKFRGRGIIHLTGEGNYKAFFEYIKMPELLKDPSCVATDPELTFRSGGWWWRYSMPNKDTNDLADQELFIEIVAKVNNRYNGLANRWETLKRAYKVLDIDDYTERLANIRESNKKRFRLA